MNGLAVGAVVVVLVVLVAGSFLYFSSNPHPSASTSIASSTVPANPNTSSSSLVTSVLSTTASQATTTISVTTTVSTSGSANSTQSFIVAVPVNLSQISQVSKFRSCEGHDYSGYDGNGSLETNRSMKHYFTPKSQYAGSTSQIQEFAPFNGTVSSIVTEHTPVGKQVWIADTNTNATIFFGSQSYPNPGIWNVVFFHLNPINGLAVGSKVTAGELIGYANQSAPLQSFDIALEEYKMSNGNGQQILDSIFNRMDSYVLAQFAKYGLNQSDMIISKAYRDANPCNFNIPAGSNNSVTLS